MSDESVPSAHARVLERLCKHAPLTLLEPNPRLESPSAPHPYARGRAALAIVLELIYDLVGEDRLPVVLFDLDSTLFGTHRRHLAILSDFIGHHAPGHSGLLQAYSVLEARGCGWNLVEDVRALGVADDDLLRRLSDYWRQRFFTSDYVLHDLPTPGSAAFVRMCHDRGAFCYYLTGRDLPNMRDGTRASLRQHGFPLEHRAHLHMKSSPQEPDLAFKEAALLQVQGLGTVVGTFENEPANANLFTRSFPDALSFFLETVHSPTAPSPLSSLYRIPDFCLE